MKSLNVIQTIAKICKIASKVIYILCCVSIGICIVALVSYALLGDFGIKIGGTTVMGLIQNNSDMSAVKLCSNIAVAAVISVAEALVARRAFKYFSNELEDGTPFTYDGAKELLKLGIFVIVLPICAVIIASIGIAIAGHFNPEIVKPDWYEDSTSTGIGFAMIIMSLLCRYGAEMSDADKNAVIRSNTDNAKAGDEQTCGQDTDGRSDNSGGNIWQTIPKQK
ncbi:MAG: hypothetical protein K5756_07565 [Clostridiales bacterium]|nr:hypothetical protein [Clostridiales bacterium]